jgi:sortase A
MKLNTEEGAVLLGGALLFFSIFGLYLNTAAPPALKSLVGIHADIPTEILLSRANQPLPTLVPTLLPFPTSPRTQPPTPTVVSTAAASNPARAETGESSFLVPGTPQATSAPIPAALIPERIIIPAIQLDAPIVPAGFQLIELDGQVFQQWDAPDEYAAGWQPTSALLGAAGNTVLNGHHNINGSVFGRLIDLAEGDSIQVYSGSTVFNYEITNKMILPERGEDLSIRMQNARWLLPSADERLTLITCWPHWSNTHRLIIVAKPVGRNTGG